MLASFLSRPHDDGKSQTQPSPDPREVIWHTLVPGKNDEIAFLAVHLDEAEREKEAYERLVHHLKDENLRVSSGILQPSIYPRFFLPNHSAWKHFELGYAVGSYYATARLYTSTLAKVAPVWLRRLAEKQKS